MPNIAKKKRFSDDTAVDSAAEPDAILDDGMEDFDMTSLDDMAAMMVEALTIPLPVDTRDADAADQLQDNLKSSSALQPPSSKRLN